MQAWAPIFRNRIMAVPFQWLGCTARPRIAHVLIAARFKHILQRSPNNFKNSTRNSHHSFVNHNDRWYKSTPSWSKKLYWDSRTTKRSWTEREDKLNWLCQHCLLPKFVNHRMTWLRWSTIWYNFTSLFTDFNTKPPLFYFNQKLFEPYFIHDPSQSNID